MQTLSQLQPGEPWLKQLLRIAQGYSGGSPLFRFDVVRTGFVDFG